MDKEVVQEIYINLDDSGKLSKKEKISVYGGIVFLSKKEKDKFITQYRSIIKSIKCNYCEHDKKTCTNECPEIKNTNVEADHRRRIVNYIKKYYTIALIIRNDDVRDHIISNKASKGRFTDYAIRRLIKESIRKLINQKRIDPNLPVKLILNIDQQSTKSNGYYNLKDGLIEELVYGIYNFNYNTLHKPILYGGLEVNLKYFDSSKSYAVQAADFMAGNIRRLAISNYDDLRKFYSQVNYIDYKINIANLHYNTLIPLKYHLNTNNLR